MICFWEVLILVLKVQIFLDLSVSYLRNNNPVFEELEVSIVDLTVANTVLLSTRGGASKTNICDRQIHN